VAKNEFFSTSKSKRLKLRTCIHKTPDCQQFFYDKQFFAFVKIEFRNERAENVIQLEIASKTEDRKNDLIGN
jgi:hypothetical protein